MFEPSIFDYFDYRKYFKDVFSFKKSQNKKFTHRYIVKQINASSSGWVSDLLKGRINISPMYRFRLAELLGLSTEESIFLEDLIQYDQSTSIEEKQVFFKRLIKNKKPESQMVFQHQFDFYRIWYIPALRELLLDYDFDGVDFERLSKLFRPAITEEEVRYAFKVLLDCGLIKKEGDYYIPTTNNIKKDPSVSVFYWKSYMESVLKLSLHAIEYDKTERDISGLTLNFSDETFLEAKAEISNLRQKLLSLSEHDDCTNKVYQCNLQLFPLTKDFK